MSGGRDRRGFVMSSPSDWALSAQASMELSHAATKTDQAYLRIRRRILNGELAPEMSLDQEAIAAALGLSTTPVREALRRLESERLVINRAHRDTVVAPLSAAALEEVYAVRLSLDPLAAGMAASSASAEAVEQMVGLSQQTETDAEAGVLLSLNRRLHRAIYVGSGNQVLIEVLDRLWDMSDRYRMITLRNRSAAKSAVAEHHDIVDAIVSRDPDKAAELMREHVLQSLQTMREATKNSD